MQVFRTHIFNKKPPILKIHLYSERAAPAFKFRFFFFRNADFHFICSTRLYQCVFNKLLNHGITQHNTLQNNLICMINTIKIIELRIQKTKMTRRIIVCTPTISFLIQKNTAIIRITTISMLILLRPLLFSPS